MVVFQAASQEKQKRIAFLTTRINPNLPISIWILAYLESHLCRMKTHHVLHFSAMRTVFIAHSQQSEIKTVPLNNLQVTPLHPACKQLSEIYLSSLRNISIKSIESKNFYQSSAHLTQSSKVQILRGPLNHALASGRYVPCHFKKI